jgi:hypothetical protein
MISYKIAALSFLFTLLTLARPAYAEEAELWHPGSGDFLEAGVVKKFFGIWLPSL